MTDVLVAKRVEDPLSDVEAIIDKGYFQIRPSRPYAANGQWVDDAWSAPINMTGSALTFKLDPLADIPYELFWHYTDGRNQVKEGSELRYVTASATPLKWENLQQTAGVGTQPAVPSDVEAQVATLAAQVASLSQAVANVSGGASNIGGISGISTDGKALIAGTNTYADMRGLLSAAPLASPTLTGNPTAPTPTTGDNDTSIATTAFVQNSLAGSGLSFASAALTGNPTAPTATPGDNDTSIATTAFVQAAVSAALVSVPYPFFATGGTYSGRPVTPRPVEWLSWDVAPPATTGTTTSGTGPVPNLDKVYLALGVVPG